MTRDGHIICHHDKSALRTTSVDKIIQSMSLSEIKKLDSGSWFGKEWAKEKVPQLEEILSLLPRQKEIFIEVKTKKEIVDSLLNLLRKSLLNLNQVTVISFFPEVIKEIKERESKLKCNFLVAFEFKNLEVNEIVDTALSINADGVGAQNHKNFNLSLVDSLKDENKTSHVWTVDEADDARKYVEMGVESITTNRPLFLRSELERF